MDYFNIKWPKTISQGRSKEVVLLAFGEGEVFRGVKVEARIDLPTEMERGGHGAQPI